jgi:hypothetical protein
MPLCIFDSYFAPNKKSFKFQLQEIRLSSKNNLCSIYVLMYRIWIVYKHFYATHQ